MRYISIALLLIASTAHAEDWQQIANLDSNGAVFFFDAAGVTEVKGLRRAWFKAVYSTDQPVPSEYLASVPANFRAFRSERTLRYFNCAGTNGRGHAPLLERRRKQFGRLPLPGPPGISRACRGNSR